MEKVEAVEKLKVEHMEREELDMAQTVGSQGKLGAVIESAPQVAEARMMMARTWETMAEAWVIMAWEESWWAARRPTGWLSPLYRPP